MTQQEMMNYRADFPLLRESKVAYLDNAATSQRPDCVLDASANFTRPTTPTPCVVCTNWVWTLRRTTQPPERRCAVF